MFNWLRNALRAWLREEPPAPAPDKDADKLKIEPTLIQKLQQAGERNLIERKVALPKLMECVRGNYAYNKDADSANGGPALGEPIAADSGENAPPWAYLNQANCGLMFPGYGYLSELTQRSEYRAPVETIATEATREWIELTIDGKSQKQRDDEKGIDADGDGDIDDGLEDKLEKLRTAIDDFKLCDAFRKISEVDGFFGRAQLFINVENSRIPKDDLRQLPLIVDKETIPRGSLRGFKVIEPIWTSPYNYNTTDPTMPDFYKPRAWFVIGKPIHASRLLTFVSREVPDILKPAYNFGGLSLTQLMETFVFQWIRTRNSVSDLIHNFSVMVLKTNLTAVLAGEAGASQSFLDRIKLFVSSRDNQGLSVIDKNTEEMQEVHASLASLDKLQAQAQEHMAAPSHIPLVKLTGITPSGLNASSEGEIQVWYDYIRAYQKFFFEPHLKHILKILQLHLFGEIDDAIGFQWVPLSSPTIKELSEIRKADAETDDKYVAMGAIAPEEVRERVAADPNSGYSNLSGPAPTPPDLEGKEHEAGLNEEAAATGHERNEEAAESAHKRTMELEKQKAKNKPAPKR